MSEYKDQETKEREGVQKTSKEIEADTKGVTVKVYDNQGKLIEVIK